MGMMELKRYGFSDSYKKARSFFLRASKENIRETSMLEPRWRQGFKMGLLYTMSALQAFTSFHNTDRLKGLLRPLALIDRRVTAMREGSMENIKS